MLAASPSVGPWLVHCRWNGVDDYDRTSVIDHRKALATKGPKSRMYQAANPPCEATNEWRKRSMDERALAFVAA